MYFDVNLTPIHKRVSWKINQNYGGRKITIRVRKEWRCKGDVKEIRTRETRRKNKHKNYKNYFDINFTPIQKRVP